MGYSYKYGTPASGKSSAYSEALYAREDEVTSRAAEGVSNQAAIELAESESTVEAPSPTATLDAYAYAGSKAGYGGDRYGETVGASPAKYPYCEVAGASGGGGDDLLYGAARAPDADRAPAPAATVVAPKIAAPKIAAPTEAERTPKASAWGEKSPYEGQAMPIGDMSTQNGLRTKAMTSTDYVQETTSSSSFRGGDADRWRPTHNKHLRPGESEVQKLSNIFTHYQTPEEQRAATLSSQVDEAGVARLARGGEVLDTRGASGIGTVKTAGGLAGKDRHIFAMGGSGELRSADPWAERKVIDHPATEPDMHGGASKQLGTINHSSFFGGDRVASAGDMVVEDGRVAALSNNSGHYRPDVGMLHQGATALANLNVLPLGADIEMHASDGTDTTSALTFLGASQGQETIAQSAFGTATARQQTEETAVAKEEVNKQITSFDRSTLKSPHAETGSAPALPAPEGAKKKPGTN